MDLSLSADQADLTDAFRTFFAKESPPTVVRDAEPLGFDAALWSKLGQMGGPTMGVAESLGGGGASLLDLELIAECFGAALAPVPVIETVVAARALAAAGDSATPLLERVVGDPSVIATLAVRPAANGTARMVPAGAVADIVIALDGDELVAVSDDPPGTAPHNLGNAPVAHRALDGSSRVVLASGDAARAAHDAAVDEWRVLTAGALIGVATAALAIGVEYATDRHQFGVPIGSFQSIARDLADVSTEVDGGRLLARAAAWGATEDDQDGPSLAAMAFLFAARTAQHATAVGVHVHGGYGLTVEYDIQLYYRRAKAWPLVLGDPRIGEAHLADALFGPQEA